MRRDENVVCDLCDGEGGWYMESPAPEERSEK